jgi:uncharacterized protein
VKFKLTCLDTLRGATQNFYYNSSDSSLFNEDGVSVVAAPKSLSGGNVATAIDRYEPGKKNSPKVLKISLGLSCNYECEYCSQRFVPRAAETNPGDTDAFIAGLDKWVTSPPDSIEFWGGEPLVYIKTLRPLADAMREKYPDASFTMVTNGSLLNPEINEWLDSTGFLIGISHDGPGQHVRGPDPLDDADKKASILDLYSRLAPKGRISFNSMLNRSNTSRAAIQDFFISLTGDVNVNLGEGSFVDAYDEGGVAQSLRPDELINFRKSALQEIRAGKAVNIQAVRGRVIDFVSSIKNGRLAQSLEQKCSMDRPDKIAVDLKGNVLTCQNVSSTSIAPNGESHRIGHVSDLDGVKLNTSRHWSKRIDCPSCPMLQICKGSCMFLEGPLWNTSCDNAYSDAAPIFAAGIEFLTGCVPIHIEGDFREDRKDIFGMVNGVPVDTKKPFPIPVVAA